MNRAAARGVNRRLRNERGQSLVLVAAGLVAFIGFVALAIDGGYGFWAKRSLQSSADAAALAGAQELPIAANAVNVAFQYSGRKTPEGANYSSPLNTTTQVTTECRVGSCAFGEVDTVIVRETADVPTFFAKIFGIDTYTVSARAVASKASTPGGGGTPYAVFVHALCNYPSDTGLLANGKNMLIQGAIHVNGEFKIGDSGFEAESRTSVYRPPHVDSPSPPGPANPSSSCKGSGAPKIENQASAMYCTIDCAPGSNTPVHGPYEDWITPYHTEAIVKTRVNGGVCTHTPTTDVTINGGVIDPPRFYCLPPDKKFTISGNVTGPGGTHAGLTVIAGMIEINATGGKLKPFNDAEPVLFYSTNTGNTPLKVNPSGALDWIGYLINRFGGMQINSGGVVSPREGLLEAEWIEINGENFTMLGKGPPGGGGGTVVVTGPVSLTE